MGIKDLNKLLRDKVPEAYFVMATNSFYGKRIAIDANHWMFANMAVARKKIINATDVTLGLPDEKSIRHEWLSSVVNFISMWLTAGITPVFVFDGEHPPEKAVTKSERRKEKENRLTRIEELYATIAADPLAVDASLTAELRKELCGYVRISSAENEIFYSLIQVLGIPCFRAAGDAEQLCSMMARENRVSAVFSGDTDNLTYGCPLLLTSMTRAYNGEEELVSAVSAVRMDLVLKKLNFSSAQFVDLCIMAGCDFNKNIRGIGIMKSYHLLCQYQRIENLPANLNTDCLAFQRCREIFAPVSSESITVECNLPQLQVDVSALSRSRDQLTMWGLAERLSSLSQIYRDIPHSYGGSLITDEDDDIFIEII